MSRHLICDNNWTWIGLSSQCRLGQEVARCCKKTSCFFIRFCFPTLVLMMWKLIDLFLNFLKTFKKLLVCWDCLFLQYWIEILILTTLLKIIPKKSEPYSFYNVSFFWGCHLSLPNDIAWNTVFIFGLVLLPASWISEISYRNRYLGPSLAVSLELTELVPLPHSNGRSTCYSNRLRDFSITIPGC